MKRDHLRSAIGFGLMLLLMAAPFLWLRLGFDYQRGTVQLSGDWRKGAKFFEDLTPVALAGLLLVGLAWVYRALSGHHTQSWQKVEKLLHQHARWTVPLGCLFIAILPFANNGLLSAAIFVGLWMILALGLNIAIGMTGLLVLGYAGFYSLGGYTFAVISHFHPWVTWWMALPLAILVGAGAGWVVGLPCLRLRGDYLAIVTLGFGECFHELVRNWSSLTHGDQGLTVTALAKIHGGAGVSSLQVTYVVILTVLGLAVLCCLRLQRSWIGRAWVAIREDEVSAAAVGIPVVSMKLLAFMISAALGAVAGVLYVGYSGFIDPAAGTFENSVMVLAMVILGGLGSVPGVLLGSALLYLIPTLLRDHYPAIAEYRLLLFGVTMVIMMRFRPQGLWGSRQRASELKGSA